MSKINRLIRLKNLKRLNEFSIEELITSFGLYESAIINLRDIGDEFRNGNQDVSQNPPHVEVGADLVLLNRFLTEDYKHMLPCPSCQQKQPYNPIKWGNPCDLEYRGIFTGSTNNYNSPKANNVNKGNSRKNIFELSTPFYTIGKNRLCDITDNDLFIFEKEGKWEEFLDSCVRCCKDTILNSASEIRRDYICGFDSSHRVFVDFRIYDPIEPDDFNEYASLLDASDKNSKEIIGAFEYLQNCLIIQKVGQYPSLADLQMYNIEKYRKILGNNSYRDFTRALGLWADGIGAGAFLYLRRILERLVEEKHQELIKESDWDEDNYIKSRFDNRIKILDECGIVIFPKELNDIKTRLYGVLSKGVHESTDDECNELFPYVEFSIERILDEQIKQKELEEKIKRLKNKINQS